jgi:THO complex subunit 2
MAPAKRKTHDGRASADAGENRPSPHRPGNMNLGQYDRPGDSRNNGRRRSSRGGQGGGQGGQTGGSRGGSNRRNDDRGNSTQHSTASRETPTPGPGSPPSRSQSALQTPATVSSPVFKREVLPFDYVYLTDERVASWSSGGREEVVKAGIQARQDEDSLDLASIFQELARAGLDGRIDAAECGTCVKEILGPEASSGDGPTIGSFDGHTYFLDILSMIAEAEEPSSIPTFRVFIASTGISLGLMRQRLDAQLLQSLGLTRDTFIRVGIRQATHSLYRQQNYNLLREESEGYSKLATELYVSSGGSTFSVDQAPQARDAFERVKGLIGTFDLDVGRVLDITLDVFASILIKQFKFFVMFLRASSWWPKNELHGSIAKFEGLPSWALPGFTDTEHEEEATRLYKVERDTAFWERARLVGLDAFFELGGRKVVDAQSKARILSAIENLNAKGDADRQWIEETGTFPPNGNRTAAQLLGFKLRYYASPARDEGDELPPNLMFLVALLIKIGFVSLRDLYCHLYPLDDDMPALKEEKEKELTAKNKSNRGGGAANALTMAGALADDTVPAGGRTREAATTKPDDAANTENKGDDKKKPKDPVDQKSLLLVNLLTIGAIPEALYILGRFPWIPELFPEVTPLINRILDYSISHVYDLTRPTAVSAVTCSSKKYVSPEQSGIPKGHILLAQPPAKPQLRWPYAEQYDEAASGTNYKFYWEGWADTIPLCQNVDDIFTLCSTLLNYSGVNIGRHPSLLSKLARIGAMSLASDNSKQNLDRWQDLLKRLLVPALSLTRANTTVVNEVYNVLRYYPVTIRYTIYAEWFEGQISRLPAMKAAFEKTRVETVSTMKRISKTNVSSMAKRLAKAAYASPGIVFNVALGQIEAYSNLTDVVVECAKYFTDLGYDVLVWSLMSSLGGKDRNRNNSEFALLPSRWLIALSKFAGKVFKRYSIMNLSPIIQYINHQLYRGNATDLVIMRELIASMAGVVPDTDFTDAQITAMTGGPALRRHTLINLQDMRYESTKTAKRLIRALTETKLAGQLLLSIAHHKQAAIYKISDDEAHIKMLATMVDEAQSMLFQYLDLLRSNLDVEEFDEHVPGIPELMTDFGLAPSLAFMIGRASLVHRVSQLATPAINSDRKSLSSPDAPGKTDVEGDVGMKETDEIVENGDGVKTTAKTEEDVQMVDGKGDVPSDTSTPFLNGSSNSYDKLMKPLVSCVQNVLPERTRNAMSAEFYVTFWSLTLSDLNPPDLLYDAEIKKIRDQERLIMNDRSDMSRAGLAKRDETKKRLADTREDILAEMRKQVDTFMRGRTRLLKQKSQWLQTSVKVIPDHVSDELLEKCFLPRMLLSPTDADYTFRMLKFLHDNAVPGFRTLSVYLRIFRVNRLRSMIFTCSVREAENLGRFLKSALLDLQRWHSDNSIYDEQAFGKRKNLHGFAKKLEADGTPASLFSYKEFRSVLFKWHTFLYTAISDCLTGTEWMQIRNAITVLKTVGEVFPIMDSHGTGLVSQLEALTVREKKNREDLALTGSAALVQLKRQSKTWIAPAQFDSSQVSLSFDVCAHSLLISQQSTSMEQNGNAAGSTAQPRTNTPKTTLKPTAVEFQPKSRARLVPSARYSRKSFMF